MNLNDHALVVIALIITSLLVRVAPAFINLKLSPSGRKITEQALPMAVFINFSVYLIWVEVNIMATAAIASILVAAFATLFTRTGLMLTACGSTLVYAAIVTF
ncbi:hypothetical protein K8U54_00980 [Pseudomonas fulva]|uniref:hypothetical protein n=1 Tax=Pseudomonas fulva TaxID=47880 RepID=UPI00201DDDFD|nr:hypothetical protein [Pseudomonas fulva]UQY35110.1 hypothetical protein K8U54_00980 [Pseudomonas fulva]